MPDLGDAARVDRCVGLAQLRHDHVTVDVPVPARQVGGEPLALGLVAEENRPVREPGLAEEAVGLGHELVRRRHRLVDVEQVRVEASRQLRREDRRAEAEGLLARAAHVATPQEREGALEVVSHRRAAADGRACRALRCRGGRRGATVQSTTTRSFRVSVGSW